MTVNNVEPTKRCSKCGAIKPLHDFYRMCTGPMGRQASCKECGKLYSANHKNDAARRARDYRKKDPVKARNADKKHRQKHSKKRAVQALAWRQRNKDRVTAYMLEYEAGRRDERAAEKRAAYADDPDVGRERSREFRKAHPLAWRVGRQKRRARIRKAPGNHTERQLVELLERQDHLCANPYCCADLRSVLKAIDHKIALSRGGSNDIGNLQWLCVPCNSRKSNLNLDAWLNRESRRPAPPPHRRD